MSFSLSRKTSVKINDKNKAPEPPTNQTAKQRGFGVKQNPILTAKTEEYVDDTNLYKPIISAGDRIRYFEFLLAHWKQKRRDVAKGKTWISEKIKETNDELNYPAFYVRLFRYVRSKRWDQLYLNCFILFLILSVIFFDGIVDSMLPSLASMRDTILMAPLIIMLVSASLPCLGTAWFVHYGYDLVHYCAAKDFLHWAFPSTLTAQYVEYFHYGGKGRKDMVCNMRIGHEGKNPTPIKDNLRAAFRRVSKLFSFLRRRGHAPVEPESSLEESQEADSQADPDEPVGDLEQGQANPHTPGAGKQMPADSNPTTTTPARPASASASAPAVPGSHTGQSEAKQTNDEDEDSLDTYERELRGPVIEMVEWNCIVCNAFNPSTPKIPVHPPAIDLYFGTHGVHYKRLYVNMVSHPNKPTCKKCYTPYDYQPPMGSAHIFPHNPDPYRAYHKYPREPRIHHGLSESKSSIYKNAFLSFLFGLQHSVRSTPLENDWRLKKWIANKFPPIPRIVLRPDERYELGEMVECKLQKFEYCRARIVNIRSNNSYDIRYDTGDELRFVPPSEIRLGTEKGRFAYRVEIAMVGLYMYFPLGLLLSVMSSSPGMLFVGPFVVGLGLFLIRLDNFLQACYRSGAAGVCTVFRSAVLFLLPVFFLFLGGAMGLVGGQDLTSSAGGIAAAFVLAFVTSLPALYMLRPPYAIIGAFLFLLASLSLIMLSMYFSSQGQAFPSLGIPLVPLLVASLFLKYLRVHLHAIWDVCLVIRPALPHPKKSMWWALLKWIRASINYYLP